MKPWYVRYVLGQEKLQGGSQSSYHPKLIHYLYVLKISRDGHSTFMQTQTNCTDGTQPGTWRSESALVVNSTAINTHIARIYSTKPINVNIPRGFMTPKEDRDDSCPVCVFRNTVVLRQPATFVLHRDVVSKGDDSASKCNSYHGAVWLSQCTKLRKQLLPYFPDT